MKLPEADWIFFFSPSGVKLFCSRFNPAQFKIAVIGSGTFKKLKELGYSASFTPSTDDPRDAVVEFAQILPASERVISASSDKSMNRLNSIIPENQIIYWPFYKNVALENIFPTRAKYLIFTSPSNARAYFQSNRKMPFQQPVAIGKTTEDALLKMGFDDTIVSQAPNEEAMWTAIKQLD